MAEHCLIKKGSNPPACGVHNVRLVPRQTSHESIVEIAGHFTFLVCPVSDQVVGAPTTH
jgi:hypothetical protein